MGGLYRTAEHLAMRSDNIRVTWAKVQAGRQRHRAKHCHMAQLQRLAGTHKDERQALLRLHGTMSTHLRQIDLLESRCTPVSQACLMC